MKRAAFLVALAGALGVGATSCVEPYGQVLMIVDTDLPAPSFAGRLRVDLYDEAGVWFDSADFPRPNADDWPASFSLYTTGERRRVLVRLRAYPEGKVRDYRGERFQPRPTFEEPRTPANADELCANIPVLELGKTMKLRVGSKPNLKGSVCGGQRAGGAAGVAFDLPDHDKYTVGVVYTVPDASPYAIELRTSCKGADYGCDDGTQYFPQYEQYDVSFTQGRYYLLVQDIYFPAGAFDVVVGFSKRGHFDELPSPEAPPPAAGAEDPRLVEGGVDATPATEPATELAVDRLVLVDIDPDTYGAVRVTLRGACLGTMASLGTADPQRPVIAEATSCVDTENVRVPVSPAPVDPDRTIGTSVHGSFGRGDVECPAGIAPEGRFACVPGGLFVLGTPDLGGIGDGSTVPERPAVIPTFWIDRHEVTVADWRKALADGLHVGTYDGPMPNDMNELVAACNLTPEPGAYEDHPVDCIDWRGARAYCQFRGGDLPTEAQWEFMASAANRAHKTRYPWGDDPPECTCDGKPDPCHAALLSTEEGYNNKLLECAAKVTDAAHAGSVSAREGPHGDVAEMTPGVFVVGLAGGVSEMTLDSFRRYDDPCWQAASITSPRCFESDPPWVSTRGGRITFPLAGARTEQRNGTQIAPVYGTVLYNIGFRCAYPGDPR